jgi:hypothetical protein
MVFAIGVALLAVYPARSDSPTEPDLKQLEQTRLFLVHSTDPDSLALAALLSTDDHREESLALIERATIVAPDRPDLVWLQLDICQKMHSCDLERIEDELRRRDPSNAAGWAGALVRAGAANDEEAEDTALAAMSRKQRFDTYYTTLIWRLSNAGKTAHTMRPSQMTAIVIGYLAAQPAPVYQATSKICKLDRLQRPGMTEACRGIANAFQQGDTYISEVIGISIAKRVWPEDSAEWNAAAEARRVYDYRSKLWLKLFSDDPRFDEFLKWCGIYHREQDLSAAQINAAGVNPNPPAD